MGSSTLEREDALQSARPVWQFARVDRPEDIPGGADIVTLYDSMWGVESRLLGKTAVAQFTYLQNGEVAIVQFQLVSLLWQISPEPL
jgi:hypothetical protein